MLRFLVFVFVFKASFSDQIDANCAAHTDFSNWELNSPPNDTYQLLQSHVYIRHGDRIMYHELNIKSQFSHSMYHVNNG